MDAADWDLRYTEKEWLWSVEPNIFLVDEVGTLPPGRALDLACGEGRNAVWLAERGWDVIGVDFSKVALERAEELAKHRGVEVEFVHADVTGYEPEEGSFDLVVLMYLHLPPEVRIGVWQRAARAVAPGGVLVLVGHDRENLTAGYGGPQSEEVLYTAEEAAAWLEELTVVSAGRVTRAVESDGEIHLALDCLVRAERPEG